MKQMEMISSLTSKSIDMTCDPFDYVDHCPSKWINTLRSSASVLAVCWMWVALCLSVPFLNRLTRAVAEGRSRWIFEWEKDVSFVMLLVCSILFIIRSLVWLHGGISTTMVVTFHMFMDACLVAAYFLLSLSWRRAALSFKVRVQQKRVFVIPCSIIIILTSPLVVLRGYYINKGTVSDVAMSRNFFLAIASILAMFKVAVAVFVCISGGQILGALERNTERFRSSMSTLMAQRMSGVRLRVQFRFVLAAALGISAGVYLILASSLGLEITSRDCPTQFLVLLALDELALLSALVCFPRMFSAMAASDGAEAIEEIILPPKFQVILSHRMNAVTVRKAQLVINAYGDTNTGNFRANAHELSFRRNSRGSSCFSIDENSRRIEAGGSTRPSGKPLLHQGGSSSTCTMADSGSPKSSEAPLVKAGSRESLDSVGGRKGGLSTRDSLWSEALAADEQAVADETAAHLSGMQLAREVIVWFRDWDEAKGRRIFKINCHSDSFAKFFSYPSPVGDFDVRTNAFFAFSGWCLAVLIDGIFNWPYLYIVETVGFVSRTACGPRLSPSVYFNIFILSPILQKLGVRQHFHPGPPKRFAQFMGALVSVTALILRFTVSRSAGMWAASLVILLTALLWATGFCAACFIFFFLIRLHLVPDDVCRICSNQYRFEDAEQEEDGTSNGMTKIPLSRSLSKISATCSGDGVSTDTKVIDNCINSSSADACNSTEERIKSTSDNS